MDISSTDAMESTPTTGEDIGKITWPRVAPDPGKVPGDFDGAGPYTYPADLVDAERFHGLYETRSGGLSQRLRISPQGSGMAMVEVAITTPGSGQHAWEQRALSMVAHVRERWLSSVADKQAERSEQSLRIIEAMLSLAMVPGQRTVSVIEDGLTASDVAAMLHS